MNALIAVHLGGIWMFHRVRWLASIISGVMLVGALAGPSLVLAGTQGSDCPGDSTKLRLWENPIGDTSDNNDSLWKCGSDANFSNNDPHTLPGDCHGPFPWSGNWNDCVDSFTFWGPGLWYACFYRDYNYVGLFDHRGTNEQGVRYNTSGDILSSLLWEGVPHNPNLPDCGF